jgi:molybdate transport system substrate-binding protein
MLWLTIAHAHADNITVFAAASLTNALSEAGALYEKEKGVEITHSFASSATLAKQIEAGAPADIFVSANAKWMDYLQAHGHVNPASHKNWLGNRLVLIVPRGRTFPVKFERGFDFASAFKGRLCTGNVDSVPAGIYAKQALTYLGWWEGVKSRVVGTQDVRAALAFVARGECAAGIVYESDARISGKVEIAGVFPESSHEPIVFPIALVKSATNASRDYWQYLQGPAAAAIFRKYGFQVIK